MKLPDNFNILEYAANYSENDSSIEQIVDDVKLKGYLTKSDLKKVSRWKSKERAVYLVKQNSDIFVKEITRIALCPDILEHERISSLRCLRGIDLPTASAILHWFHEDRHPIWDWRALKTIGLENKISYERWQAYVSFCRDIAEEEGVDMRTLDRALWQYSNH